MTKSKKIVLFGTGDLAKILCEYFTEDSDYEVAGFTVDKEHLTDESIMGLPVVPFEDVESYFPPESHDAHVCIVYKNMNRNRAEICKCVEAKRYTLASYISSHSFIAKSAKIGKHACIFEDNTIQPFVEIGDNVVMWSGNHVGHHSTIDDNVFISSHCVISGHCRIGGNSFMGVNSTLANNTTIGKESWIMHGSIVGGDVPEHSMVRSLQSQMMPLNEEALNRALDKASEKAHG